VGSFFLSFFQSWMIYHHYRQQQQLAGSTTNWQRADP
jgi:hypothetical protein